MKILILSTWFPYPPNQGSKIRAYHLIRGLAKDFDIFLLSFEDAPVKPEWEDHMRKYCSRVEIVKRHPFEYSRAKTIMGFFSLVPSHVVAGYSPEMEAAVEKSVLEWDPDLIFALTFVTAPYALKHNTKKRIVDIDNLLALMLFEQYQNAHGWLRRARHFLAYWKLRRYESRIYSRFDLALVCSKKDVARAQTYIRLSGESIGMTPNGVDLSYLYPTATPQQKGKLIFNGALTYEPNLDAMQFFLGDIFPRVLVKAPHAHIDITGKTEGVGLSKLQQANGRVNFTGYLEDIRPAIIESEVCVVPLRMGAGTRVKILEAMALGTPVVSTSKGAEGLEVEPETHLLIADDPEDFARQTLRLLEDDSLRASLRQNALQLVREKYNWEKIGSDLSQLVRKVTG